MAAVEGQIELKEDVKLEAVEQTSVNDVKIEDMPSPTADSG